MPAASPLEAIRDGVVLALQGVSGLATYNGAPAVKTCPSNLMFGKTERDGFEVVRPQTLPDAFPGCVVSLVEHEGKLVDFINGPSSGQRRFQVRVVVTTYVISESGGVITDDAQLLCWAIAHRIDIAMVTTFARGESWNPHPYRTETIEQAPTDANTYGVIQTFVAEYSIGVGP